MNSFIVLWDLPAHKSSLATFYRRLEELLRDQGGKAFCRATRSAYIVRGDGAKELAYAIGKLAERFGAGRVGEDASRGGGLRCGTAQEQAGGCSATVVLPLGELPADHFQQCERAERWVDALCTDRRNKANRRAPPAIAADAPIAGDADGPPSPIQALIWDAQGAGGGPPSPVQATKSDAQGAGGEPSP